MTGYTVHTGSNKKFVSGWDQIFQGTASTKKSATGMSAKKKVTKKAANKLPVKQKVTLKKRAARSSSSPS